MKKVLCLLCLLGACTTPRTGDITHFGNHHYTRLIDVFYQGEFRFEVRQCSRPGCPATDTFPNPKIHR